MWTNFDLTWDDVVWKCEAKVYDSPSIFGIRMGRVSKLSVLASDRRFYQYDRGWRAENQAPEGLIDELMKKFPEVLL